MKTIPTGAYPEIPLNMQDKSFYAWEQFGYRALVRISFDLQGGPVDAELLRQAYISEVRRWPALNATIVRRSGPGWNLCWAPRDFIDSGQAVREYDFSMLDARAAEKKIHELQFDPFPGADSRKDLSFFLYLCRLPGAGQKLLVFLHHALTDAHGISLVLGELFYAYNSLHAGMPPEEASCNTSPPAPLLPEKRSRRFMDILETLLFLTQRFFANRGKAPAKMMRGPSTFSGKTAAVMREISAEQLSQMRSCAKKHGAGLNSLLAAAQITAVANWKKEQAEQACLISAEVHTGLHAEAVATRNLSNRFSTNIVDSAPAHRATPAVLLQHTHRQLERARKRNTAAKMLSCMGLVDSRIGAKTARMWVNFLCNNPRIGDSTLVTNLGRLWAGPGNTTLLTQLGDADIASCYMAGPPIPSMGSYSAFLTFKNRMFYTFNYFDWALTDADARRFTGLFEQALADLTAGAPALSTAAAGRC